MPLSQRICAYRFVQEGLTNAHRHCQGAAQTVTVDAEDGYLRIAVVDDGPGFDPDAVSADRIGIAGLRERIESLGGRFLLNTSSGGTKLEMTLAVGAAPA